jgi:RNA polymerase sigma-70 factor (ECF subfamily)
MDPGDELIERARRADRDAFGALIQPVLARGLQLAVGALGDRHAAEDALQDAVLTAWRKLGNVRPGAPIEPWFLAVVANRCRKLSHLRNRPTVAPDLTAGEGFAERANDRLDIQDALSRLSVQHRLLVVLRYYFDLSIDEAARIAGIPTGTAKSRLHRALASLRVDLEGVETTNG